MAAQKASKMASEPRFSISPLYREMLDAAFDGSGRSRRHLGLVFRGAFCLNLGRAEDAILIEFAVGESLRAVFEGVGKWIAAGVGDLQFHLVLDQGELHLFADPFDGAAFDIPAHTQFLAVGLVSHLGQFGDGLIVGFVIANAGSRQPHKRANDNGDQGNKLAVSFHTAPIPLKLQYSSKAKVDFQTSQTFFVGRRHPQSRTALPPHFFPRFGSQLFFGALSSLLSGSPSVTTLCSTSLPFCPFGFVLTLTLGSFQMIL